MKRLIWEESAKGYKKICMKAEETGQTEPTGNLCQEDMRDRGSGEQRSLEQISGTRV